MDARFLVMAGEQVQHAVVDTVRRIGRVLGLNDRVIGETQRAVLSPTVYGCNEMLQALVRKGR